MSGDVFFNTFQKIPVDNSRETSALRSSEERANPGGQGNVPASSGTFICTQRGDNRGEQSHQHFVFISNSVIQKSDSFRHVWAMFGFFLCSSSIPNINLILIMDIAL